MDKTKSGFTIVELLIVIVVIGILAAITIVAYNGIQNRSYDSTVQSDLSSIAKKVKLYHAEHGVYPAGPTQLATLNLKVTKSAYGNHFSDAHNLVYCRMPDTNPTQFAIIGFGRSGKHYQYNSNGQLKEHPIAPSGSPDSCAAAGINLATGSERDWFYYSNNWQTYVAN